MMPHPIKAGSRVASWPYFGGQSLKDKILIRLIAGQGSEVGLGEALKFQNQPERRQGPTPYMNMVHWAPGRILHSL